MKTKIQFLSYLAEFFLKWELFQTNVVGKIKKHILHSVIVFFNRAVYEVMWKDTADPGRPQITTWRMLIASWITKATNTHSEYVIFIAFPLQKLLHKHASMLRYTKIACLF
jgi:hypothetical protein